MTSLLIVLLLLKNIQFVLYTFRKSCACYPNRTVKVRPHRSSSGFQNFLGSPYTWLTLSTSNIRYNLCCALFDPTADLNLAVQFSWMHERIENGSDCLWNVWLLNFSTRLKTDSIQALSQNRDFNLPVMTHLKGWRTSNLNITRTDQICLLPHGFQALETCLRLNSWTFSRLSRFSMNTKWLKKNAWKLNCLSGTFITSFSDEIGL